MTTPIDYTRFFINSLTGDPNAVMNWRIIHDSDKSKHPYKLKGTLTECYNELLQYNTAGWGIFTSINAMDDYGTKLKNVSYIRTHVIDLDDPLNSNANYQKAINSTLPPHLGVQTSPNKFHLYWLVEPYTGNDFFTEHQRKFIKLYSGDKKVTDASRIMRVPGFYHCKKEPKLVTCWNIHNNPRYTNEEIRAHLEHVKVIQTVSGERTPLGDPSKAAPSLDWLTYALYLLHPKDLSRDEWRDITAAFKQAGWSLTSEQELLAIWQKWCTNYGEKNDPEGENLILWNSFKETQLGWATFKRLTNVEAEMIFNNVEEETVINDKNELPDILDAYGKQIWFKNCYFIESEGKIFSPTGRFMNSVQFNGKFGSKEFSLKKDGSKLTDDAWKAALRSIDWTIPKVDHIRFLPDKKPYEIIEDELGRKGVNIYLPAKIQTKPGDVTLWLEHLSKCFNTPEDIKIWQDYLAHCIKYPGCKIPWAPVLQSAQGIGKKMIGKVLKYCLGNMYVYQPKASELVASGSKFNAWMRAKLLIMVDEIKIDERRELVEVLKPMITDEWVEVQSKGVDQSMEDNVANWIFFSNHKDCIPVKSNDRRYSIFYSSLQSAQDIANAGMNKEYFDKLYDWLDNEGGLEAIAYYYQNYNIEKGGLPHRAPDTSSTEEALRIGRSPLEVFIDNKIEGCERGFKGGFVSWTVLLTAIEQSSLRKPPDHVIKEALENRGYVELGRLNYIIPVESALKPPLIYGLKNCVNINDYEKMQS